MKCCDLTIQMKPLQRHFRLVLFASKHFTKKKLEIWPYFDNWATSRIEKVLCLSHAWAYHASNVLPNKERVILYRDYLNDFRTNPVN